MEVVLPGPAAVLVSVTVSVLAGSVIVFVSVRVIAPPPEPVLDPVVAAVTVPAGPTLATTHPSAMPAATATVTLASTTALRDPTQPRLSTFRSHRNGAGTNADGVPTRSGLNGPGSQGLTSPCRVRAFLERRGAGVCCVILATSSHLGDGTLLTTRLSGRPTRIARSDTPSGGILHGVCQTNPVAKRSQTAA
jgi:hypothetical protein